MVLRLLTSKGDLLLDFRPADYPKHSATFLSVSLSHRFPVMTLVNGPQLFLRLDSFAIAVVTNERPVACSDLNSLLSVKSDSTGTESTSAWNSSPGRLGLPARKLPPLR